MCLHTAVDFRLYVVVGTSVMVACSKSSLNFHLVDSPLFSWTDLSGQEEYLDCQTWSKFLVTCSEVLLSSLTISTKLVPVFKYDRQHMEHMGSSRYLDYPGTCKVYSYFLKRHTSSLVFW